MPGILAASGRGADDGAAGLLFEFFVSGGVIKMMMGIEDVRQAPAGVGQRLDDRRRLGGIDCCRYPGI